LNKLISNKNSVEAIIKKAKLTKPDFLKNLHLFKIQVQKEDSSINLNIFYSSIKTLLTVLMVANELT